MFFPGLFQKSNTPVTTPAELAEAVGMTYDTYRKARQQPESDASHSGVWLHKGAG
jgi:hypothetical protein